jgi:hypothetical protein
LCIRGSTRRQGHALAAAGQHAAAGHRSRDGPDRMTSGPNTWTRRLLLACAAAATDDSFKAQTTDGCGVNNDG